MHFVPPPRTRSATNQLFQFFCKRDQACAHYVLGSQPTATKCRCRRFESARGARWIGFSEDDATTARRSRKVRIDELNQAAVPHLPTPWRHRVPPCLANLLYKRLTAPAASPCAKIGRRRLLSNWGWFFLCTRSGTGKKAGRSAA